MRLQIGNFPKRLGFEERLAIGGALGFESSSISLEWMNVYLQTHSVDDLRQLFARDHIAVGILGGTGLNYQVEGEEWERGLAMVEKGCQIVAELGGKQVGINSPFCWPKEPGEYEWDWLAGKYRQYADMLRQYDMNLVIEFHGAHWVREPRRGVNRYSFIDRLDRIVELVELVDRANVGVILDVMHWWSGGSTYEDLRKLKGMPLHLHFFDIPHGVTPDTNNDWDRVLPGEGMIDLVRFLRVLKEGGFDGDVWPELTRAQDLDEADSWEGPKRVRDAYLSVLKQV